MWALIGFIVAILALVALAVGRVEDRVVKRGETAGESVVDQVIMGARRPSPGFRLQATILVIILAGVLLFQRFHSLIPNPDLVRAGPSLSRQRWGIALAADRAPKIG